MLKPLLLFKNPALIAYLLSLQSSKVAMATRVQQRWGDIVLCPRATGASALGRWGGLCALWPVVVLPKERRSGGWGRLQIQLILAERRLRAVGGVALQLPSSVTRAGCLLDFQGALGARDSRPLIRRVRLTLLPPCSSDSASIVSDLHSCRCLCGRWCRICDRLWAHVWNVRQRHGLTHMKPGRDVKGAFEAYLLTEKRECCTLGTWNVISYLKCRFSREEAMEKYSRVMSYKNGSGDGSVPSSGHFNPQRGLLFFFFLLIDSTSTVTIGETIVFDI